MYLSTAVPQCIAQCIAVSYGEDFSGDHRASDKSPFDRVTVFMLCVRHLKAQQRLVAACPWHHQLGTDGLVVEDRAPSDDSGSGNAFFVADAAESSAKTGGSPWRAEMKLCAAKVVDAQ